ncbi:hypothetical protein TRVA0_013S01552 [Trichomonascus vanleenenianus]|uniref:Upf3p n=1 Tax=Trichomonascus vanleenenianus TaxID=2268995 RepID=UPI003ECAEEEF
MSDAAVQRGPPVVDSRHSTTASAAASTRSSEGSTKSNEGTKPPKLRLVVRFLPPGMAKEEFDSLVALKMNDETCTERVYMQGKVSSKDPVNKLPVYSRAYATFKTPQDLKSFFKQFKQLIPAINQLYGGANQEKTTSVRVEYAPSQTPIAGDTPDPVAGTISESPAYQSFLKARDAGKEIPKGLFIQKDAPKEPPKKQVKQPSKKGKKGEKVEVPDSQKTGKKAKGANKQQTASDQPQTANDQAQAAKRERKPRSKGKQKVEPQQPKAGTPQLPSKSPSPAPPGSPAPYPAPSRSHAASGSPAASGEASAAEQTKPKPAKKRNRKPRNPNATPQDAAAEKPMKLPPKPRQPPQQGISGPLPRQPSQSNTSRQPSQPQKSMPGPRLDAYDGSIKPVQQQFDSNEQSQRTPRRPKSKGGPKQPQPNGQKPQPQASQSQLNAQQKPPTQPSQQKVQLPNPPVPSQASPGGNDARPKAIPRSIKATAEKNIRSDTAEKIFRSDTVDPAAKLQAEIAKRQ